jgi:predicted MFS family arabinose efflux permease
MSASTLAIAQTTTRRGGSIPLGGALAAACCWNLTSMGAGADALARTLGTGLGTVGLLGAGLWLLHALAQLPSGWAIDRFGRRSVGCAALAGLVVANAAASLVPETALIGVTRLIVGVSCGAGTLCALMYARGATAEGQGIVGAATSAAAAAPLVLVPLLLPALGWRTPFLIGAVLAAVVLVPLALSPADKRRGPRDGAAPGLGGATLALVREPALLRLSVLLGALTMLNWTMGNWIVPLLTRDGRFAPLLAGLLGAMIFAGGIVARPVGAWVPVHTRVTGAALISGCLLTGAVGVGVIAAGAPVWLTALGIAALGLTAGMPWAVILHAAGTVNPDEAAAGIGVVGTLGTLAAVVSIPLFGTAFDSGHETIALAGLVAFTIASILAVPWGRSLDGRSS